MNTIKVAIEAYILALLPNDPWGRSKQKETAKTSGQQLQALANGLAVPSFWSAAGINGTFAIANKIWSQAAIEFSPIQVSARTEVVPADENGMWIHFLNHLRPKAGIAVGFVYDLPSEEGGWGGGRIAVIAEKKAEGAIDGYLGSVLAHELGHVLLNTPDHVKSEHNLMFAERNRRKAYADQLEPEQIKDARERAQTLQ
jgi:hypothetical protein